MPDEVSEVRAKTFTFRCPACKCEAFAVNIKVVETAQVVLTIFCTETGCYKTNGLLEVELDPCLIAQRIRDEPLPPDSLEGRLVNLEELEIEGPVM